MKQTQGKLSRRTLFAGAGTAGAIAAVTSVMPSVPTGPTAVQSTKPAPTRGGGYHLSEHVKRYFKTTLV
ncbi:MAG: formate dehydrogenase [Hylemonella sp.]|nr:formate dehydrogenase [Hylemonella sp.]MDH5708292.1 formate dehydrogenase [Hylemonella sp.]